MTGNTNDIPSDTWQAQFDRHTERLSPIETDQLVAVIATYQQRLSEPQYRERHPGFSLSVVLKESPYRPSDRLTQAVAMLETWLSDQAWLADRGTD